MENHEFPVLTLEARNWFAEDRSLGDYTIEEDALPPAGMNSFEFSRLVAAEEGHLDASQMLPRARQRGRLAGWRATLAFLENTFGIPEVFEGSRLIFAGTVLRKGARLWVPCLSADVRRGWGPGLLELARGFGFSNILVHHAA